MRLAPLLALALLAASASAQVGDCATGTAVAYLENAGARAPLYNTGSLFWDDADRPSVGYEVPKGSGVSAMFVSSLWIGGLANGNEHDLRLSATRYGPYELWPGPLAADGGAPSAASCAAADRIWRVTLADVARYNATGATTADLAEWPASLGAPVVDGDGDPSNYDLAAGDRPAVLGDETAWWVMNDRGNAHEWSQKAPLGVEVRATSFTVSEPYARVRLGLGGFAADVHVMTFHRYEVRYRGEQPITGAYVGFFTDGDVGDYEDDYVGSYPERDLLFFYNQNETDGEYGPSPPASGLRILAGPLGSGAPPLSGAFDLSRYDGPTADPGVEVGEVAYRNLRGLHRDGVPLTRGGSGYNPGSTAVTPYVFSDLPPSYWSQMNADGSGTARRPVNARALASHGPFEMAPGATYTVDTAYLWARSDLGAVASVNRLVLEAVPAARTVPFTPDPDLRTITPADLPGPGPTSGASEPDLGRLVVTASPNPSARTARVQFDLAAPARVRLEVFDALGRLVAVPVDGAVEPGERHADLDVSGWPPGAYVYRLSLDGRPAGSGRLVVAR